MTSGILRSVHRLDVTLMAAGLIGVCSADLWSRHVRDPGVFAEAVRPIAVFSEAGPRRPGETGSPLSRGQRAPPSGAPTPFATSASTSP